MLLLFLIKVRYQDYRNVQLELEQLVKDESTVICALEENSFRDFNGNGWIFMKMPIQKGAWDWKD